MKILFITNEDSQYGGAKCLMELISHLDCEVTVINPKHNQLSKWCEERNIPTYSTNFGCNVFEYKGVLDFFKYYIKRLVKYYLLNPIAIREIERNIDVKSFDIIHSNTSVVDIGARLAERNGIKHIWHLREFPRIDYLSYLPGRIKFMNSRGQHFISISNAVSEAWTKKGISGNSISTLYDGIELNNDKNRAELFSDSKIKIIFIGYIYPVKGQLQLVRAISKLNQDTRKRIRVDFYGDYEEKSEYYQKIQSLIKAKKMEKIFCFKGYYDDVGSVISEYDVGINCSPQEGFGRSTVEFMANGLLVIACDTGANPEIITHNKNGLLYKGSNIRQLSRTLQYVCDNKEKCIQMACEGSRYAHKNFNIEKNIEKLKEFYSAYMNAGI